MQSGARREHSKKRAAAEWPAPRVWRTRVIKWRGGREGGRKSADTSKRGGGNSATAISEAVERQKFYQSALSSNALEYAKSIQKNEAEDKREIQWLDWKYV